MLIDHTTELGIKIWSDIRSGVKKLLNNPCSVCRSGEEKPRQHFHGSDWGKCPRSVQLSMLTGDKEDLDGDQAMFFLDGHIHESSIIDSLRAEGYQITGREDDAKSEIIIDSPYVFHPRVAEKLGIDEINIKTILHTDGIIDDKYLIECKAVKKWTFDKYFSEGKCPDNYYGQVQAYLFAHDLLKGFLIAKHRESGKIAYPIEIRRDEKFIEERIDLLASIVTYTMRERIVDRPPDKRNKNDTECKFCPFKDDCWKEG